MSENDWLSEYLLDLSDGRYDADFGLTTADIVVEDCTIPVMPGIAEALEKARLKGDTGYPATPSKRFRFQEEFDEALCCAVCELTKMTPEKWKRLSPQQMTPWLESAIANLESQKREQAKSLKQEEEKAKGDIDDGSNVDIADGKLALAPGGFTLGSEVHELTVRPLQMLRILLKSRHHRVTADQLRDEMRADETATYSDQVVRDAATKLRGALKKAAKKTGLTCPNHVSQGLWPLLSTGKSKELAYTLAPELFSIDSK